MDSQTIDSLREDIQAMQDRIEHFSNGTVRRAKRKVAELGSAAYRKIGKVGGQAYEVARERPVLTLLGVAAVGAVAALLVFRSRD